jgi:hypothetical protein
MWKYAQVRFLNGHCRTSDFTHSSEGDKVPLKGKSVIDVLEMLGDEGWELTSVIVLTGSDCPSGQRVEMIFKKKRPSYI